MDYPEEFERRLSMALSHMHRHTACSVLDHLGDRPVAFESDMTCADLANLIRPKTPFPEDHVPSLWDAIYELEHYLGHAYQLRARRWFGVETHEIVEAFEKDWRNRERERFISGRYQRLPWDLPPIPLHFAHVSTEDPNMVAFTENPEKGKRDIQQRMKPGRYLRRFYPCLSEDTINEMQASMTNYKVKFAVTADEIEAIYTRRPGIHSCMAHHADEFDGGVHPVRVYGDSDLQLAYLEDGGGALKARALVWPEKKKYGRIYGDILRLKHLLKELGYDGDGSGYDLNGARIRAIKHGRVFIMPYIDGQQSVGHGESGWFILGGHDVHAGNQNGLSGSEEYCAYCEEGCHEVHEVRVGRRPGQVEAWCTGCCENEAAWCEHGEVYIHSDYARAVVRSFRDGEPWIEATWSEWAADDYAYYCDGCEAYVADSIPAVTMHDGETWAEPYFRVYGITVDNENYRIGDQPEPEEVEEPTQSEAA